MMMRLRRDRIQDYFAACSLLILVSMKNHTSKLTLILAAILTVLSPVAAKATVLGFDDLTTTNIYALSPTGYGGLNWSTNFYILDKNNFPGTGYENGVVSGNYVAYNAGVEDVSVSGSAFTFDSAYFASAWNDQILHLEGWLDGAMIYSADIAIVTSGSALFNFNWTVDTLTFHSTANSQFVLDNMSINSASVPDGGPSFALLGLALLGLGVTRRIVRV